MVKPYIVQDTYFKKAKIEGYVARSAYKLQEIDEEYRLLRSGISVLDLGCAPGSFLQYTSKIIGQKGCALGVDLQKIDLQFPNAVTHVCDIYKNDELEKIIEDFKYTQRIHHFDIVLSDLAPNTSGRKDVDQWRSVELCMRVVEVAEIHLKKHGTLLMKIFQGEDFDEFYASVKKKFVKIKTVKPDAVRERSKEVYLVCFDKI